MARNLGGAQPTVVGYRRTSESSRGSGRRSRPATVFATPCEADVIHMWPDAKTWPRGSRPGDSRVRAPGRVWIDMSTIDPLGELAGEEGARRRCLDARRGGEGGAMRALSRSWSAASVTSRVSRADSRSVGAR